MMNMYLSHAVRLNLVILLVDPKTGLKTSDMLMLRKLNYYQKRVQVVFTKIDKVQKGRVDLMMQLEKTSRTL